MAFLTISGIEVLVTGLQEEQPELIGEQARTFAGGMRSQIRAQKRSWNARLLEMTEAAYQTLYAAVDLGEKVTVSGDFIGGANITCIVHIGRSTFNRDGTGFLREPEIRIIEV